MRYQLQSVHQRANLWTRLLPRSWLLGWFRILLFDRPDTVVRSECTWKKMEACDVVLSRITECSEAAGAEYWLWTTVLFRNLKLHANLHAELHVFIAGGGSSDRLRMHEPLSRAKNRGSDSSVSDAPPTGYEYCSVLSTLIWFDCLLSRLKRKSINPVVKENGSHET